VNIDQIGVFDSGVGGLTVLREIANLLPDKKIIYLGDTARVPYGSKSPETVNKFSEQGIKFLQSKGVKLIVIACNTVSALSLDFLKERTSLPLIGVLEPGAEKAISLTKKGIIGVIGTEATIASKAYTKAIMKIDRSVKVVEKSCPLLVPLAEEGWLRGEITKKVIQYYLRPILKERIDTLILGCTHYPLFKDTIQQVVGEEVKLIDSAKEVALRVREIAGDSSNVDCGFHSYEFFVTDQPERFARVGKVFLKKKIYNKVKKINLE